MPRRSHPIYYAAVAGDILGTYLRWKAGVRDERQTALTYSAQFFELCKLLGRRGIATFPDSESRQVNDSEFSVRSRPFHLAGNGARFYVFQLCRALWLFVDVTRSRAGD